MLQSMRHLAHSWVVKGLMLILMISFSIWGIGDIFRGNPLQKQVAKAGDTVITVQALTHSFEQSLIQARQKLNPNLTAAQAKELGMLDSALQGEIKRALVEQDIKRLGLSVPPESVLKLLAAQPQFRAKDGSFDKDKFRMLLQQQGLNERNFVAKAQQDMARQILLNALGSGSSYAPQTMIDALYKARAQQRILDVVTIDAAKIGGITAPDDKSLQKFYEKNPQDFTAPEYRGVTIATLSTEALAKDITVTDDQVKKEYDARQDQLAKPEQRDIVQVVAQDEAKAKQLTLQARMSKDLTATAKLNNETPVPLDKMQEKNLLPELGKAVFALPAGGVTDPVKTQLGWHIVQVKNITPAGKPGFDSIKEQLREEIKRDQAVDSATRIVNQIDGQLAAGHTLEDIADGQKLRLVRIAAVDAAGVTPDGATPAEFPNKEAALKDAFGQNSGESSPVEDDKDGNYYVVRTDGVTPATLKPFDKVKDSVAAAWKKREQNVKAAALGDKIAKALQEGKAVGDFAGQDGVSIGKSAPLSQLGDGDENLPPALVAQAVKLRKGESATVAAKDKLYIARVASLIDVDPAKTDTRKNMVALKIKQSSGEEILDQYLDHLRDVFPVTINAAAVDQIRQQE